MLQIKNAFDVYLFTSNDSSHDHININITNILTYKVNKFFSKKKIFVIIYTTLRQGA